MLNLDLQNHRPLREIVYEELKRQILVGEIAPGTRMMEVELAEEMGVSRTPIREAIRKLEKEGLVTIEPRRGAYASEISVKDMVDVLEVRQDLEGMAAALAAEKVTEEEKQAFIKVNSDYEDAIRHGNTEEIIRCDELFHQLIVVTAAIRRSISSCLRYRNWRSDSDTYITMIFPDTKRCPESMSR